MYLELIALASIGYALYRVGSQIWNAIRCFVLTNETDFASFGQWAVVTGATGGIGKAFVKEMASRGLDVYLLGRSEEKLTALQAEMKKLYPSRQFRTLCVDFQKDENIYETLSDTLGELDVGVLVNNAGRADDLPGFMHEMSLDLALQMMHINMSAPALLCHCVLGGMKARQRGAIINVASFAACNVCPKMSLYAATKTFLGYLTQSLESEYGYGMYNIKFQCLFPSFVQTKMAGNLQDASQPNVLMPSPEAYVRSALNTFGVNTCTTGYWFHSFFKFVLTIMPCNVARKLGDQKMEEMIDFAKNKRSHASKTTAATKKSE